MGDRDGAVRLLGDAAGLPLAVQQEGPRPQVEVTLAADDTLLLYTDGLVERRDADLDEGVARAAAALAAARRLPPDQVVGALTGELLVGTRDDDVALLVYRPSA